MFYAAPLFCAMPIRAAAAAVVFGIVLWGGLATIYEIYDDYACEAMDGYAPAGTADAAKYPPDTLAGMCMRAEAGDAALVAVAMAFVLAVLGYVFARVLLDFLDIWHIH